MTAATELFGEDDDFFRVFTSGTIYRRMMGAGASQSHHTLARRGPTLGRAHLGCGPLGPPPQVILGLRKLPDLLFTEEKIFPDFDDIFRVGFSKTKNSRKHGTGTLAS